MEFGEPIHATAFAYRGAGCLVFGDSGNGKSHMMAEAILHGAQLIADDCVRLCASNGKLVASPVSNLLGVMELRGLGLIKQIDALPSHPIHLVLELDQKAQTRLPEKTPREYMGITVPFLTIPPVPHTPIASLLLYLRALTDGQVLATDWRPDQLPQN